MKRAAIYGRYSTDLQLDRSIADQFALCDRYAASKKLDVIAQFEDRARSAASLQGRPGIAALMDRAKRREFDVVIVESLDRISRDMEDLAGVHKRLNFYGVRIDAVQDGEANTLLVGIRGLTGQIFREDNAHKVRRGLSGRVREGLSAGGSVYSYRTDPLNRGKRVVCEEEAAIVRRIFEEYAQGKTPRAIAHGLNQDHVPPPRGRKWNASTINGSGKRGSGIVRIGRRRAGYVWNKVRMIKVPDTGRRVSRPNPPDHVPRR